MAQSGYHAAMRKQIICLEVPPHPCYTGCTQVSGALICTVQFPIASPTKYNAMIVGKSVRGVLLCKTMEHSVYARFG